MLKKFLERKKPIINEVFGEVDYGVVWWIASEKESITLWNKSYDIDVCAVANDRNDPINSSQEQAYERYKSTICDVQNKVQELIENYYNTKDEKDLISKFFPKELVFGKKGECALMADNADDADEQDVAMGLTVCFEPELKICTQEEYMGIFYRSCYDKEFQKTISNVIGSQMEIISVYCNFSSEIEDISLETNGI